MVGKLAVSLAGHDKGSLYLVIGQEGDFVFLADGVHKTWNKPKKKREKHIRPVSGGMTSRELEALSSDPADADTKIKRYIRLYQERNI